MELLCALLKNTDNDLIHHLVIESNDRTICGKFIQPMTQIFDVPMADEAACHICIDRLRDVLVINRNGVSSKAMQNI